MKTDSKPTLKQLREFGLTVGGILGPGLGAILPFALHRRIHPILLGVGLILMIWGVLHPQSLEKPRHFWLVGAEFIGKVNSKIILTILYCLIFIPVGVLSRILGKDPLELKPDPKRKSYRSPTPGSDTLVSRMKGPY